MSDDASSPGDSNLLGVALAHRRVSADVEQLADQEALLVAVTVATSFHVEQRAVLGVEQQADVLQDLVGQAGHVELVADVQDQFVHQLAAVPRLEITAPTA